MFGGNILCTLGNLYLLAIFARIVVSWFPVQPGTTFSSIHLIIPFARDATRF